MTFIQLGGAWINPDHIVSIIPRRERGDDGGCTVHLVSGPTVAIGDATAEQTARHLATMMQDDLD